MKTLKRLSAMFLLFAVLGGFAFAAEPPQIEAGGYLILERSTNTVLLEENADVKLYPASVTKLLTALIAIEHLADTDVLVVEASDTAGLYERGSNVFLKSGEEILFNDLLHYLLIASGNDASNTIARRISGGEAEFAVLMNQKAKELGCTNSNFANPHGLHDDNHYTTARDLSKIGAAVANNPKLAEICAMASWTMPPTNKHPSETLFYTTNHLISRFKDKRYIYEGANGLKTGWTDSAGMCLVATAQKNDLSLLTVVMNAPRRPDGSQGSFTETTKLLNYGFDNFKRATYIPTTEPVSEVNVALAKKKSNLILSLERDYDDILPAGVQRGDLSVITLIEPEIQAPIEKGQVLGTATITYQGQTRQTINLVANDAVERSQWAYILHSIKSFFTSKLFLISLGSLFAVLLILLIVRNVNIQKRRKRKKAGRYKK